MEDISIRLFFLEYANELVVPTSLKYKYQKKYKYWLEREGKSLFDGLWLDVDLDEVRGIKPIEERDINGDYYGGYYYLYGNKGRDTLPEELEEKMIRAIGYVMENPGFMHRPELQMTAFAVPEVRDYICKKIYEKIKDVEFDSLFFFVGLGGGTGTGVISNITGYIRIEGRKTFPSFVLAALTGKNDARIMRTQASLYRRSFNALWALSDLLAGKKVDCMILVDNDKISEIEEVKKDTGKLEGDALNRHIIRSIFPLLGRNEYEQIDESVWQREMALSDFKPILIPCYWHGKMELEELIENAVEKGKLADCDHKTADAAYVITKGFGDDRKKIKSIVKERLKALDVKTDEVRVWRTGKTGGNPKDKEILILLSNPGIKELLLERIEAAITFIRLIQNNSDEVTIKKVKEAVSMFLMGQDLENYVQLVRDEAWEFLHLGEPYKFTEEAIEGKRRFIGDFKKELEEVKNRIENGEREIFKENVKIELDYLFSIDAKFAEDLNRGVITEELKKEFTDKGVSLENVKVTKSGDEWVIADKMTKLILREEEGKLKIHSKSKREWDISKRSEVEQIIKEEIRSLGVKRETGPAGPVISEQIIEKIARLEKERASPEEIGDLRNKINMLEAMISASVSEEIIPPGDSISKESEERKKKIDLEYLDFDLEISDVRGREYPVSVIRSPAGEARETMHFPFDELALKSRLKDLKIALLQSRGKHRMVLSPEEQTVQDFGCNLFDALFTGELRSRYDVSLANAAEQGKGLRLKLRIQSPELAALPWEYLYNSRQAEYVCLSRNTPVVRYLELPQPIQPLTLATPMSILGMVVSPRDLPKLDTEREKLRVEEAIKDLQAKGRVNLTWLKGQTWRDLQRAMRGGTWHVFHFIGHGGFDHNSDEGFIALADEEGNTHKLSATQLGRLLGDHRHLRLALLNACEGARGSERDIFSSTAAILVRRGIPAVLAMQYEITDLAAIEFAQTFYESLADEMPVDAAVAEARKAISLRLTNTVEWGTPVLYMRTPDGVLFRIEEQERGK